MRALFIVFIVIPIIEMWLLIEVGSQIGAMATIFLVFLTAAVGLALLRQQGLATLFKVNQRMQHGQLPATEILEGVALAIGGALLLTPGFITDGFGFICLIPITRKALIATVLKQGLMSAAGRSQQHNGQQQEAEFYTRGATSETNNKAKGNITLEGEFRRDD